jgi:hypothetical protein
MDPSHSLFMLTAKLNRHLETDHYGQLELNERAIFSRSRRTIEELDGHLHRENAKNNTPKSA